LQRPLQSAAKRAEACVANERSLIVWSTIKLEMR